MDEPTATSPASRIIDFQRNASFVAFMLVVVSCTFLILVDKLRTVLQPLIWAIFFALPLERLVVFLSDCEIRCLSSSLRCIRGTSPPSVPVPFWHVPGRSRVRVVSSEATLVVLDNAINPLAGWPCHSRQTGSVPMAPSPLIMAFTSCCRRRLRIRMVESSTPGAVPSSHALMHGGRYHLSAIHVSPQSESELNLDLSLDGSSRYPVVIENDDCQEEEVTGFLEVDKTSAVSLTFAIIFVILLVLAGVALFASLVWAGAQSLLDNIPAYQLGVKQFFDWLGRMWPGEEAESLEKFVSDFMNAQLPALAETLLGSISNFLIQALFMVIYLLFWLTEPIPVSPSVGDVFKGYLFLKTTVCILFASLMSLLLMGLNVKIWPLFFVLSFLLNYIPEVGPMLCAILCVFVVLFDGNTEDPTQRAINSLILLIIFGIIKVITGNIIEMRMYANRGGEFMRMHPVVLIAMMFVGEVLLGLSGMFLSVPITAALKYYLVTADMPRTFLDPLLIFIEGNEMAPHKNSVDRARAEKQRKELDLELRTQFEPHAETQVEARAPLLAVARG